MVNYLRLAAVLIVVGAAATHLRVWLSPSDRFRVAEPGIVFSRPCSGATRGAISQVDNHSLVVEQPGTPYRLISYAHNCCHCGRKGLFIQMTLFTHAIKGAFISLPGGLPSCFMPHVLNLMWGVAENDAHYSKL
jgi:hypothetical protein